MSLLLTTVSSAQSGSSQIGPSGGQAAAAIAGGAAAAAVVIYLVVPKDKTLEGCVSTSDQGMRLTVNGKNTLYLLTGDNGSLHPGTSARLKGKFRGKQTFEVHKLVREEGSCSSN